MRGFMKPIAAVPLALLTMVAMNGVASAQQSADQIIAALKPSGSLASGATRGIKMGGAARRNPRPPRPLVRFPLARRRRRHRAPSARRPTVPRPSRLSPSAVRRSTSPSTFPADPPI